MSRRARDSNAIKAVMPICFRGARQFQIGAGGEAQLADVHEIFADRA